MKLNKLLAFASGALYCSTLLPLAPALLPLPASPVTQATSATKTHILVLIDRSGSVHFDADKAFQRVAEQISRMEHVGDELGVAYIHSQTETNPQRFTIKAQLPANYEDLGGASQSSARMRFNKQLQAERSTMKAALRKMLATAADAHTQEYSDVWGSLATMNTFFQGATSTDRCQVFIVSDLVESMPGANRRDFHKQHPANDAAQLQKIAQADVPKIRSIYGLGAKLPLGQVDQLTVLFPASGVQASQNNAMTQYWTNVFEQLGLSRQKMLFQ